MSTISSSTTSTTAYKVTADTTGTLVLQTGATPTTAVTVDASQNVGIGTASPVSRLHVTGSGSPYISITSTNTNNFVQALDGSGLAIGTTSSATNKDIVFYSSSVERARFNSTGALVFVGGTTTANGIGITFPATQSASTDANTLDDYEEGTWTPGASFGGGTTGITYHADNGGRYTRVGSLVTLTGYLRLSNKGSSTGTARITGLPFMPTGAGETGNFANAMGYTVAITYSGTLAFYASAGAASLFAISNSSGATSTVLTDTAFANTSQTVISLSYLAT